MATYKLISSTTLSSSQSTITFSSIPSTYTDLVIKASTRDSSLSNAGAIAMRFNSSTTNYNGRIIYSDGSTATGSFLSGLDYGWAGTVNNANYTANTFSNHEIYIPSYNSSTAKPYSVSSVVETNANLAEYLVSTAGLWNGSEITSIVLTVSNGSSFASGSSFDLYGIENVDVIAKATGGTIKSDGTYIYHTFTSSGTFTPKQSLSCDYLVIAGGGGAGGPSGTYNAGSGGGAGGLSYISNASLTAQAYTVTVGGGGNAGGYQANGSGGSNSSLNSVISNGGGGGGLTTGQAGGSGGGGGAGSYTGGTKNQGNTGGATGYGNNGGTSAGQYSAGPGGGGGAGAVGGNGTGPSGYVGGVGGAGLNTWSSWATATGTGVSGYYAGGGGGGGAAFEGSVGAGAGGAGGGGGGGYDVAGTAGTANTGGGGGGTGDRFTPASGGNGGSGVVIVRYAI